MTVQDKPPVCSLDLNPGRSAMTPFLQHLPNGRLGIGESAGVSSSAFEYTLLRVFAGNVPHRIYAKDTMGRFIFANGAVARGMGVSDPVELLGKTDFDFYSLELATDATNTSSVQSSGHDRPLVRKVRSPSPSAPSTK